MTTQQHATGDRAGRAAFWAGLVVALGAAAATAHGLYEVAAAAGVPIAVAVLYPLITDGLALVAYAATSRLRTSARLYAWLVVVLAAGLSGLAQAVYLAGGLEAAGTALRFGVGAWPAVAAAIAAHLIHLLARPAVVPVTVLVAPEPPAVGPVDAHVSTPVAAEPAAVSEPAPVNDREPVLAGVQALGVQVPIPDAVQPGVQPVVLDGQQPLPFDSGPVQPVEPDAGPGAPVSPVVAVGRGPGGGRPGERARAVAREHHAIHGDWPTVRELADLADVSTGTAGTALTDLRNNPDEPRERLHLVTSDREASTR